MIKKLGALAFVLIFVAFSNPSDAQNQEIYWFDYDENLVLRWNPETSAIDTLSRIQSRLPSAMDLSDGELYWVDASEILPEPTVFRKGYPGEDNASELFTLDGGNHVLMIRVDVPNDYVYWLQHDPSSIHRARLDGTDIEEVVGTNVGRFRIDHASEKLYWTEHSNGIIRRSNLDGSQAEEIIADSDFLRINDVEIDTANEKIYWSVQNTEKDAVPGIYQSDLDSGGVGLVIEAVPRLLTMDRNRGMLYWLDEDQRTILRTSVDSGVADTVLTQSSLRIFPNDIMFDPSQDKLLWVGAGSSGIAGFRIMQADPDGSNVEEILPGFGAPMSVVIDPIEENLYWTTGYFREVMKASLDGLNVQALVREQVSLSTTSMWKLFLDKDSAALFWGYDLPDTISKVGTDGDQLKSFDFPGFRLHWLNSIAFDPENSKLYAAVSEYPSEAPTLLRVDANDPENGKVEILLDEEELGSRVTGLGIDLRASKMYWTERFSNSIRSANLDGSAVEELLTDLSWPSSIAMDVENGKIYWTERSAGTISRASLDGTDIEVLFSGLSSPGRPYFASENIGVSISLPMESHPLEFSLHQNYPNPFNPVTAITYSISKPTEVKLTVYNMVGQEIAVLFNGSQNQGVHRVEFDASHLASGIYLYKLVAGNVTETRKMTLVK